MISTIQVRYRDVDLAASFSSSALAASHGTFQAPEEEAELCGRVHFVDLAGSERTKVSGAEGLRMKEAQNINKSLAALGDVLRALAKTQKHIPYRNSKLTYLLQDALGGSSKVLMFAQVSPDSPDVSESFSTLNFASRVASIEKGRMKQNVYRPAAKGQGGPGAYQPNGQGDGQTSAQPASQSAAQPAGQSAAPRVVDVSRASQLPRPR
jgi:hypothetical protein